MSKHRFFIQCVMWFAGTWWSTSACMATTITVNPTGAGSAVTIQEGLCQAAVGDTVLVWPGVYAENIVHRSGVTLLSRSGHHETIIDGQGGKCIKADHCASGTRVVGFTLSNGGSLEGGGVWVVNNSEIEIAHNLVINHNVEFGGAGVWVQRYSHALIHHNRFENTTSHLASAIAVIVFSSADIRNNVFANNTSAAHGAAIGTHKSHVVVVENLFINNQSAGDAGTVDFFKSTGQVFNNTFVGNSGGPDGASGVAVRGATSHVSITRNLFANHTGGPVLLTESCQEVTCNIFWQNSTHYAGLCPPIGQEGNLETDPLLIAGENGRFEAQSPCQTSLCGHVGNLSNSVLGLQDPE